MSTSALEIRSSTHTYPIHLGSGLLAQTGTFLRRHGPGKPGGACAVVTDETVAPLYADIVLASLRAEGFAPHLLTVPSGERSKSLAEVERLSGELAHAGLDRHAFIVALGGGVVGDLAGFLAAVYYRGIPCVQIPTTVVSQVDSSVGGKTGVNLAAGKNLVGAFHPPALVLADVDTLKTLPVREFNEGMAEAIKHAAIRDRGLLDQLVALHRHDPAELTAIIRRNLEIKADIVARDEFERGDRALLNFGHTLGHAIEQAAGYGRYLHGEAVSLGIVAAARLSRRVAGLPLEDYNALLAGLRHFGLPTALPPDFPVAAALESMARDKKFASGAVRFVLCPALGTAYLSETGQITTDDLRHELENLRTETSRRL